MPEPARTWSVCVLQLNECPVLAFVSKLGEFLHCRRSRPVEQNAVRRSISQPLGRFCTGWEAALTLMPFDDSQGPSLSNSNAKSIRRAPIHR